MQVILRNKPILDFFKDITKPNQIISIFSYRNNYGAVADFEFIFNFDKSQKIKDTIKELEDLPTAVSVPCFEARRRQVIDDFIYNEKHKKSNARYIHIRENLKVFPEDSTVHVEGIRISRKIITPGDYSQLIPRAPAEDYFRNRTSVGKFVQFALRNNNFTKIICDGKVFNNN